jgi:hypothetical protein
MKKSPEGVSHASSLYIEKEIPPPLSLISSYNSLPYRGSVRSTIALIFPLEPKELGRGDLKGSSESRCRVLLKRFIVCRSNIWKRKYLCPGNSCDNIFSPSNVKANI